MVTTTQSVFLGYLVNPSGHRLVLQTGTFKFKAQTTKVTMTVRFRRLYAGQCTPTIRYGATAAGSARIGGYIPYITTSMYTQTGIPNSTAKKLIVQRRTGLPSGLSFSYALVGL